MDFHLGEQLEDPGTVVEFETHAVDGRAAGRHRHRFVGLGEIEIRDDVQIFRVEPQGAVVRVGLPDDPDVVDEVHVLAIVGKPGDAVDYSPLEHEMAGGLKPGVRKVRIFKPGVEARSESGGRRIVRKAIVEPLI